MRRIAGTSAVLIVTAAMVLGCGSRGYPPPAALAPAEHIPAPGQVLPEPYRLRVGDQVSVLVLDQPELSGLVRIRPDGMLTAPGAGDEIPAAGRTVAEVTESLRAGLRRILRYPDVSVMLTSYVDQRIYVFGEVQNPGAKDYVPEMTALHALGMAAGGTTIARLDDVIVLRRSGPTELEVYQLDLSDALHAKPQARDLFLQPYDVVFVPRTLVGEINLFLRQWIGNNMVPFGAYIEGWRAFHVEDWKSYDLR